MFSHIQFFIIVFKVILYASLLSWKQDVYQLKYYVYLQDVLAEVPYQVVEYMERNNIPPGVPDVQTALKLHQMQLWEKKIQQSKIRILSSNCVDGIFLPIQN